MTEVIVNAQNLSMDCLRCSMRSSNASAGALVDQELTCPCIINTKKGTNISGYEEASVTHFRLKKSV